MSEYNFKVTLSESTVDLVSEGGWTGDYLDTLTDEMVAELVRDFVWNDLWVKVERIDG